MTLREWEHQQAEEEQQRLIHEALEKCHKAGAPQEELRFLAWQAGCGDWKPTELRRS